VQEEEAVRQGRKLLPALALALLAFAATASSASASFHFMKVREVYPGSVSDSGYVELQMWAAGQNLVNLGQLRVYNANGSTASTFQPASKVGNPENNRTILIADSAFGTAFPGITPDFTDSSLNLSPAAGAVCWPVNASPIDCVSWGAFTGNASLPAPAAGSPLQGSGTSGAVGGGKAIIRSIAPGCSTFLEDGDDTNNSATNFSETTPNPRPNSAPVVEMPCSPGGGGGGGPTGYPPTSSPPAAPPTTKKKCKKHKHRSAQAAKKCKKHK
jgi:hypothetical protein